MLKGKELDEFISDVLSEKELIKRKIKPLKKTLLKYIKIWDKTAVEYQDEYIKAIEYLTFKADKKNPRSFCSFLDSWIQRVHDKNVYLDHYYFNKVDLKSKFDDISLAIQDTRELADGDEDGDLVSELCDSVLDLVDMLQEVYLFSSEEYIEYKFPFVKHAHKK